MRVFVVSEIIRIKSQLTAIIAIIDELKDEKGVV